MTCATRLLITAVPKSRKEFDLSAANGADAMSCCTRATIEETETAGEDASARGTSIAFSA